MFVEFTWFKDSWCRSRAQCVRWCPWEVGPGLYDASQSEKARHYVNNIPPWYDLLISSLKFLTWLFWWRTIDCNPNTLSFLAFGHCLISAKESRLRQWACHFLCFYLLSYLGWVLLRNALSIHWNYFCYFLFPVACSCS